MPDMKEPMFFATDMPWLLRPPRPGTLEEYLCSFADAGNDQRAGEASPVYLASHTAPLAIAKLNPDARIIAVFREPAGFLRSLHLQLLRNRVEDQRDLRRAIALEEYRSHGGRIARSSNRPPVPQCSTRPVLPVRSRQQPRRSCHGGYGDVCCKPFMTRSPTHHHRSTRH